VTTGASAKAGDDIEGTMLGELVSKTSFSGHRLADFMRIIDLSTFGADMNGWDVFGEYRSAMNSIARRKLPTKTK